MPNPSTLASPRDWPHFRAGELSCRCCGQHGMDPQFMERLEALREAWGKPLVITSAYRCGNHPVERAKMGTRIPGEHTMGRAVDVAMLQGEDRTQFVRLALNLGFKRIGIGASFIHLGGSADHTPAIWSY